MISWPCWRICQKISSKKIINLNTQYFSLKLCLLGLWTPGGEGLKWREKTLYTNDPSGGESGYSYLRQVIFQKYVFQPTNRILILLCWTLSCFSKLKKKTIFYNNIYYLYCAFSIKYSTAILKSEKRNMKTCASKRFFRGTVQRKWGNSLSYGLTPGQHSDFAVEAITKKAQLNLVFLTYRYFYVSE